MQGTRVEAQEDSQPSALAQKSHLVKAPPQSPGIAAPEAAAGGEPGLTCPLRRPAALGTAPQQSRRSGGSRRGPASEGSCQAIKPTPGRTACTHSHIHTRRPRATASRQPPRFPQRHGCSGTAHLTFIILGAKKPKRCSLCSVFCYFCCTRNKQQRTPLPPSIHQCQGGREEE